MVRLSCSTKRWWKLRRKTKEPITSMAFVLTMGDVSRFQRGKQVASYLGLIPREYSSGGHQRLGSISKQGNRFLRMLLVEAAQGAVRCDPGFRNEYLHRCHKKAKGVAKVAAARKLAIRLYWMLRTRGTRQTLG
jgi:transposase